MDHQACARGYRDGKVDRGLGQRSEYMWWGVDLDPHNPYAYWASVGYRAGWRAR